jgi:hypothetical protein
MVAVAIEGRGLFSSPPGWESNAVILGRVDERAIRLYAYSGNRNSFGPLLRGRVVRSGDTAAGSSARSAGVQRVRAFFAVWIGLIALGFIASVIVEIVNVVTHDWGAARVTLAMVGATAAFVTVGCLIVSFGTWLGRTERHVLLRWLPIVTDTRPPFVQSAVSQEL